MDAVGSSIFNFPFKPYLMNGIGLSWQPANLDTQYIDRVKIVSDLEAFSTCHLLAKKEGLLVGGSSGAVLFACLCAVLEKQNPQRVLGIMPDSGTNYLKEIFSDEWLSQKNLKLFANLDELFDAIKHTTPSKPLNLVC
ncbi:pyridoxal-phosphate dependent enzyme [Myxosarcina sp. GI1(2024)]